MALFVVQHQHKAEDCPARDKNIAPMLLSHLSEDNAKQFGIRILSDAVIDGGHTLYLTAEATDSSNIQRYMEPFARFGSVEIHAASRCETVVERGFC